ncbi:MAG TPA: hypothetical protein VMD02_05455 [Candidatus Omnitrophota bacterium]|nr:hypothetical protein [Candidatus Omnitrophota bacterium]
MNRYLFVLLCLLVFSFLSANGAIASVYHYHVKVVESSSGYQTPEVHSNLTFQQASDLINQNYGTPIANAANVFSNPPEQFTLYTNANGKTDIADEDQASYAVVTSKSGYNTVYYNMSTNPSKYAAAIVRLYKP